MDEAMRNNPGEIAAWLERVRSADADDIGTTNTQTAAVDIIYDRSRDNLVRQAAVLQALDAASAVPRTCRFI